MQENIKKKINVLFILITIMSLLTVAFLGLLKTNNKVEAENYENLEVTSVDTEEAHILKVSNIKNSIDKVEAYSSEDKKIEFGKKIYKLLGANEEEVDNLTEEELEQISECDEVERHYSILYVPETPATRSTNTSLDVIISNPEHVNDTEVVKLRESMSLTLTFFRSYETDYTSILTNKDGEKIGETHYMGLGINMKLLWISGPKTKLVDKLYVFTDKSMQNSETKMNNTVLNNQSSSSKYNEYTMNLPDSGDVAFTGNYYYRILDSASFNFRIVYLHHKLPSVGFDGNVTVNADDMDVTVSNSAIVQHTKYITDIYTINVS